MPWWPLPRSFKNEYLKSTRNDRTVQPYQTYHYWFVAFKKMHVKIYIYAVFFIFFVSFCRLIFNAWKTTRARCVSAVGRRKCRSSVFSASSDFMEYVALVKQTGLLTYPLHCTAHLHNPGATSPPLFAQLTWWNGLICNVRKQSPFFFLFGSILRCGGSYVSMSIWGELYAKT